MDSIEKRGSQEQLEFFAAARAEFDRAGARRWLIGGWAVDLHLGRVMRDHSDVDLALWKRDGDRLAPRRHDLVEVGTLPAVAATEEPTRRTGWWR